MILSLTIDDMLLVIASEDLGAEPDPVIPDLTFVFVQVSLQVACDACLKVMEVFLDILVDRLELLDEGLRAVVVLHGVRGIEGPA